MTAFIGYLTFGCISLLSLELDEGIRSSPLVEGPGPLLPEHGKGTVACAVVLAQGRVHVSRLDHINRGGDDGGAETRPEGRGEVAREVICHETTGKAVSSPSPRPTIAERGLIVLKTDRLQLESLRVI